MSDASSFKYIFMIFGTWKVPDQEQMASHDCKSEAAGEAAYSEEIAQGHSSKAPGANFVSHTGTVISKGANSAADDSFMVR